MKKSTKMFFAAALASCAVAYGAGFTILEQSARGLGRALAGMTVESSDPGSIYFNPATATGPERPEIVLGNHVLYVSGHIKDMGSDIQLGGDESNNLGGWSMVPNLYYVQPINSSVSLGFGLSATSGTKTSYNNYWLGRYGATLTELTVIDFSSVVAWKIQDNLSLGAGLVVEKAGLLMEQMVPVAVGVDRKMSVDGDSIGLGFTLGILYEPIDGTKVGLGYRSRIKHDIDFDAELKHTGVSSEGSCEIELPQIVNFGVEQKLTEKWDVMMDISWSEWSTLDQMTLEFDDMTFGQKEITKDMKWRDNWRVAVGTAYQFTDKFTGRFGLAFDQTPTQNEYRNLKLPDANRYWISMGCGYKINDNVRIDAAYTHLFMDSQSFEEVTAGGTVRAKERCRTELFSFSITYSF
ncbi:MAG: outer membrane protein transport protein [Victivallales bacterium]|nr:outer membrane protein transport protein [Victivallales bacterium]